jgi:hypothetical protein
MVSDRSPAADSSPASDASAASDTSAAPVLRALVVADGDPVEAAALDAAWPG